MAAYPYNTARWQRLRIAKLNECPICEACQRRGVIVGADAVDHIVAISAGGAAFPSTDGLKSLCYPCHNSKTGRVDRGNRGLKRGLKGCDLQGNPLDPDGWEPSSPAVGREVAPAGAEDVWF
ncbi:hypothetical protein BMJ26_02105 [Sinorhizobium medicae]|uniref:HNH endonuclease signature motif containing protein n=1 Tax=Sinorhizobium medicae TaxID=110321 RepID=UPI000C7B9ECC|nr:hypothetical protein BMJ31_12545 [Sinorhizobium medicae]PLU29285.1 hypothetical protein BMJ28_26390 [Sinorhizobium medicae]PLU44469.1 hypothetical protein BMJ26_02105 [Sinorhizobium medicae]PLU56263.1 hypothetical protein BMJ24_19595 [Sinorhizobium medicae]PLU72407.1 hypothetical protein BMJ20_06235 [Sinorhizobium medicae]